MHYKDRIELTLKYDLRVHGDGVIAVKGQKVWGHWSYPGCWSVEIPGYDEKTLNVADYELLGPPDEATIERPPRSNSYCNWC